jgi:hypothetical protein
MREKIVSGLLLALLVISVLTSALNVQPVKASPGTIYIRPDGSIDPPTAPISSVDNVTYTFTSNINDSIVVQRNNIVIDGVDYTVQGTGSYAGGINLTGRTNITIKNMEIRGFYFGVYLRSSFNNAIWANNITDNEYSGVLLSFIFVSYLEPSSII